MTQNPKIYTLEQLAEITGGTIHGDANCQITGIASLQEAKPGQIAFLANPLYRKYLPGTHASAVILAAPDLHNCKTNALIVPSPYTSYARITQYFDTTSKPAPGIHSTVVIGNDTDIHSSCSIGPNVVIGNGVSIGANTTIGAGSFIGEDVTIGADSVIFPNVTLYHMIQIGERVTIHSGVVIGSDGFGFAFDKQQGTWVKIHHLGTVQIGNDVEIGANTTIDRGAVEDTIIEHHVKIDNLVQVAHNVKIGAYTVIAGCVGLAGSARIGKYCLIGGAACVAGHIEIADNITITGMSMVTHSLNQPGTAYSSGTGVMENSQWKKNVVRFWHLDDLARRVQKLERQLKE
ncbi:MAG: UDP-3-O-(3-hydroxymyristoyl)glucosamine N-acyltransferase [Gammaproteobacteria bacterium]